MRLMWLTTVQGNSSRFQVWNELSLSILQHFALSRGLPAHTQTLSYGMLHMVGDSWACSCSLDTPGRPGVVTESLGALGKWLRGYFIDSDITRLNRSLGQHTDLG